MCIKYFVACLAFATSLGLSTLPARAETSGEACDRLATHSSIKSKPKEVKGVPWDKIDVDAAVKSCAEAVSAYPDVARYRIQYGRALNKAGKNDQALAEYEVAKKAGLWEANIFIGDMYFYGDFGSVDYPKAFAVNIEAAEHGIGYSANTLGIWYRDGVGVPKDFEKSLSWLRKAHELGDKNVAVDLGYAYEHGLAVKVDLAEAFRWYQSAANAGNAMAMNNMGVCYANGIGVAVDKVKALVWFRKAEAEKVPLAYINIAGFVDDGTETDVNHKLAAEYVLKAFDEGDKWNDPGNRDIVLNRKWTSDFWREMQTQLQARGHYSGPIDGKPTDMTKAALEKIVDK